MDIRGKIIGEKIQGRIKGAKNLEISKIFSVFNSKLSYNSKRKTLIE
jgi:hypothetical protein